MVAVVLILSAIDAQPVEAEDTASQNTAAIIPPQSVTKINGEVPPGVITHADVKLLLRAPLVGDQVLYQYLWVRPSGTRAPIHTHPVGGSTCIIEGETTLRIEGIPGSRTYGAGECVFMPKDVLMVNFMSGTKTTTAIDTFILGPGDKPLNVFESGHTHVYNNDQ
jgi:hypothetical protein